MPTQDENSFNQRARDELQKMEEEYAQLGVKIERLRQFLALPSPNSAGSRMVGSIKKYLERGPASFEKILNHIEEEIAAGKIVTRGVMKDNVRRSLSKSVSAGTIIQSGEKYKLP